MWDPTGERVMGLQTVSFLKAGRAFIILSYFNVLEFFTKPGTERVCNRCSLNEWG